MLLWQISQLSFDIDVFSVSSIIHQLSLSVSLDVALTKVDCLKGNSSFIQLCCIFIVLPTGNHNNACTMRFQWYHQKVSDNNQSHDWAKVKHSPHPGKPLSWKRKQTQTAKVSSKLCVVIYCNLKPNFLVQLWPTVLDRSSTHTFILWNKRLFLTLSSG